MARTKITFDVVREIGLGLPDVEESTMYGALALKVRGNLLACKAINKSAEQDSLVVRIDFDQRDAETLFLVFGRADVLLSRVKEVRVNKLQTI